MDDQSITARTATLTDELWRLVKGGVYTMRLVTCPTLGELSHVDERLSVTATAHTIRRYLEGGIARLTAPEYHVRGQLIPGHRVRWAIRVLLGFEGRSQGVPKRQERVINHLGLGVPLSTFHRRNSVRYDILWLLAEQLVKDGVSQS